MKLLDMDSLSVTPDSFGWTDGAVRLRFATLAAFLPLARFVLSTMGGRQTTLIINEWGIWPSSEDWFAFDALSRHAFGETSRIRPMQFEANEADAGTSFLCMAMQSGWGGVLFAGDDRWFRFDHDGFALLYAAGEPIETPAFEGVSYIEA